MTDAKKINESAGREETKVPCIKCAGRTAHTVMASVDQSGDEDHYYWTIRHQVIECRGCGTISFRLASSDSESYVYDSDGNAHHFIEEKLYPSRVEGRKGLGIDEIHLPAQIRAIYSETIEAIANQSPVLAGIGLRALVEAVCKEKGAPGENLFKQINSLQADGTLSKGSTTILHQIRTLGNDAAHESKAHSASQLSLAMDIIENLLKEVYIHPKLAANAFSSS